MGNSGDWEERKGSRRDFWFLLLLKILPSTDLDYGALELYVIWEGVLLKQKNKIYK